MAQEDGAPGLGRPLSYSFRLGRLLDRGAFGDVHEAVMDGNIPCAAKLIKLPVDRHQSDGNRQLSSALDGERNLCQLKHRNIVQFYGYMIRPETSEVLVFMELIRGVTLEEHVDGKPMAVSQLQLFSYQICSALDYLHSQNPAVIHRDLSCRNILIASTNQIKLIDFGLSLKLRESVTHKSVSTSVPKGAMHFMAPELFADGDSDDASAVYCKESDVWAFGCNVFLMATGQLPFKGCANIARVCTRVMNKGAPDLPSEMSDELKEFYAGCTAKKRQDRKTAAQLLNCQFIQLGSALNDASLVQQSNRESEGNNAEARANDRGEQASQSLDPPDNQAGNAPNEIQEQMVVEQQLQEPMPIPNEQRDRLASVPVFNLFDVEPTEDEVYKVTRPQGLCLVINIYKYDGDHYEPRSGSQKDSDRVSSLFNRLGFLVEVKDSPTRSEMLKTLDEVSRSDRLKDLGILVCFVMAHGRSGAIQAKDGESVEIRTILNHFRADRCHNLRHKPKLFFFQSCRTYDETPTDSDSRSNMVMIMESDISDPASHCPNESDFLMSYSSSEGAISVRNSETGSYFVQTLCDVIEERYQGEHVLDMMTRVNKLLKTMPFRFHGGYYYMVPEMVSRLSKKCFLNPALAARFN